MTHMCNYVQACTMMHKHMITCIVERYRKGVNTVAERKKISLTHYMSCTKIYKTKKAPIQYKNVHEHSHKLKLGDLISFRI